MTPRPMRLAGAVSLLAILFASPVLAQSIAAGRIEGRITDPDGRPLAGALVTLGPDDGGRSAEASVEGRFAFPLLAPGVYALRVEALGSRPLVVRQVRVDPGETTTLEAALPAAAPPVERSDTLVGLLPASRVGGALAWVRPDVVETLPRVRPDLASLLEFGSIDAALGIEGLPERLGGLFVDGHRFQPARHPSRTGDPALGLLLPATSVAGAALPSASDVEWSGASGDVLSISTGVTRNGPEMFGRWGGDRSWRGRAIEGSPPSFSQAWGGAATSAADRQGNIRIDAALEGGRIESPFPSQTSDSVAGFLGTSGEGLADVGTGQSTWASGAVRLSWTPPRSQALQVSLAAGNFSRSAGVLSAQGAPYSVDPSALEGTDVLAGADLSIDLPGRFAVEVRGDGTFSRRRFGDARSSSTATWLVDPSIGLGRGFEDDGDVTRMGLGATGILHVEGVNFRAKIGVEAGLAAHEYDLRRGTSGTFFFGGAAGVEGAGAYVERVGSKPATSFAVPRGGFFAQYGWTPSPSLTLTVGGRYGVSSLPAKDIRLDETWLNLTGIPNAAVPTSLSAFGGLVRGAWEPRGGRYTVLEGSVGLDVGEVDPAALYEVIANDGTPALRRVSGDLSGWPSAPAANRGATAVSLSLLDPAVRPPRTSRLRVAFTREIAEGTTLHAEIALRQTDFLLRRSDLNAPLQPAFTGEGGRPVLAPLSNLSGVVGPTDAGWRRFAGYDAIWALNADGWSRQRAVSLDLTRRLAGGLVFADYTFSRTTDNLWGLGAERVSATLRPNLAPASSFPWEEGTSDLDVPHRLALGMAVDLPTGLLGRLGGIYRLRSGAPFTPMVARGLDVNGDGSWDNDVAWAPAGDATAALLRQAGCDVEAGSIPERNACRGPAFQQLDLSLTLGPVSFGGGALDLRVELLNATDHAVGIRDDALVRVAAGAPVNSVGSGVTLPYELNAGFGSLRARSDPGRMLRVGVRVGVR